MARKVRGDRWLPINFSFGSTSVSVKWLDFGHTEISDPFFNQTVKKLKSASPAAIERLTDLGVLLDCARALPFARPSGLIFHVSRCGSTLIGNALRTAERLVLLSEARPIGVLFRPSVFRDSPFPEEGWDEARKMFLDAVATIYSHRASEPYSRLIIKCHAINLMSIRMIRASWPETPSLIVIRDPLEVIVSNFAKPARWLQWKDDQTTARRVFGWPDDDGEELSAEDYSARGLGSFFDSAIRAVDDNCKIIDYSNIDSTNLQKIAAFFNINIAESTSARFQHVLTAYSKDPDGLRQFEDDQDRKQRQATEAIKESVRRWARRPYELLRARESW
jgi:hypothetical protein